MKIFFFRSIKYLKFRMITLFFISLYEPLNAGDYIGGFEYYYFNRQPSAKAEAMGRSAVATEIDAFGCLYNPALISLNNGLCLGGSIVSPYYLLEQAKFYFYSITYTSTKYGSFGFSRYEFNDGLASVATDENGNYLGSFESTEYIYTLTYAYELPLSYYIGINLSYFYHKQSESLTVGAETTDGTTTALPIDIGILKRIPLNENERLLHMMTLGASMYNILGTNMDWPDKPDPLPQVFHFGFSYRLHIGRLGDPGLRPYQLHLQVEYQDVFNATYHTGFKIGGEFALYEMLFLRIGHYSETLNDYGLPASNKDAISELTYGFGVALPLNGLFGVKCIEQLKFDMLDLKQPSASNQYDNFENYTNYNLTIVLNL